MSWTLVIPMPRIVRYAGRPTSKRWFSSPNPSLSACLIRKARPTERTIISVGPTPLLCAGPKTRRNVSTLITPVSRAAGTIAR
jgi:hypothetical protein